jgi:RNA polymerase sigma-70 factor, ECF subfamily
MQNHLGLVLKVVRTSVESPHDQEDLFQDVLLNLWLSLPNFRGDAKESTWIYRVAINTALVWHRGERRRRRRHAMLVEQSAFLHQSSSCTEPIHAALIDRMYAVIRQLPPVDASLALMHLDGLSYREMAEVLGITENYVGVKLNRIRKQLAEMLAPSNE